MRLKKYTIDNNKKTFNIPFINYNNKSLEKDKPFKTIQNESIYLNKVLKKNLCPYKANTNMPDFQENITNFHSNIRNILSNEESREKAMKYVINMRNKSKKLSPYEMRTKPTMYSINKNDLKYDNFSRSINEGFYDAKKRKINKSDFQDNNDDNNNYIEREYDDSPFGKLKIPKNQYTSIRRVYYPVKQGKEKRIKVNKKNDYDYDNNELPNKSRNKYFYSHNLNDYKIDNDGNLNRKSKPKYQTNRKYIHNRDINTDNYDNIYLNKKNKYINSSDEDIENEYYYNYINKKYNYNDEEFIDDFKDDNNNINSSNQNDYSESEEIYKKGINAIYQSPKYNKRDINKYFNNENIKPENSNNNDMINNDKRFRKKKY